MSLLSFLTAIIFTIPKFKADGESSGDVAIYLWVMISARSSRDQPSWTLRGWRSFWPTAERITQTELNLREKIGMSELTYLKLPNCQLLVHVSRKFVKPYKAWFGLLFFPSRRARGCLQLRFASAKMCQRYTMVYHIDPHCMCGILWYAGMPRKSGNKRVWMGFDGNAATEVTALDWGLCYWNVKALMFLCDPELAMNLMSETVKNGLPEELGVQTLLWKRAPQVKGRASCRALPSGRKDHHGSLSWMLCFLGNNQ